MCRVHTYRIRTDTKNDTRHTRTGEVGLCRVHTYRIRTDTENDTQHPGQEKWDCAESIHAE
ncbi:unnamed protein product [Staurois parvus]|uniref:Uncharacterized protein n=1 Tax=Staurois parvus TaxID=386267 RepID=A0ABN9HDU4_9NEOB|nr:unnamed protein product [Staurois parvus]